MATRLAHFELDECAPTGYTVSMKTKDAGLGIRVDRELRDAFVAVCRKQDKPAAQELRDFIRDYGWGCEAPKDRAGAVARNVSKRGGA